MADNPIELIREAELEAGKNLQNAALEAERLIREAHLEAARGTKRAEEAASAAADAVMSAAREACKEHTRMEEAKLREELEALSAQAQSRKESAIEALLSMLV